MAVIGQELFSESYEKHIQLKIDKNIQKWNFVDVPHSFMIVFRVLCGEWIEPMWDCMEYHNSTWSCVAFFLCVKIIGGYIVSAALK